jgi:hypothetical protein
MAEDILCEIMASWKDIGKGKMGAVMRIFQHTDIGEPYLQSIIKSTPIPPSSDIL